MTGPLSSYESPLRAELVRLGYAAPSVREAVRTLAHLSGWMAEQGLAAAELTPAAVEAFVDSRRAVCRSAPAARRSLGVVLRVLRGGVVPSRAVTTPTAADALLADYRAYLVGERGLAAESVRCYSGQARKILALLPDPLDETLARLDATAVTAFVVRHSTAAGSIWSAKAMVTALRSLLRYLHVSGRIAAPLAVAVPAVAGWRLDALPRGLRREQVAALLAAPDPGTAAGQRDRAVLLVLARLGLRGGEVAALRLVDVDWRAGEVVVRGKGSRVERLPLSAEIGEALVGYLTSARPRCACPALFVTARAPYQALTGACIRAIVGRACVTAGLPRLGAHRLRHTLATELLRAGAPLTEVGQVLRHRSQLSTAGYAKVDQIALRALAQPWPGGAR
ncbi:MAG: integrase [Chloroflexota bacterium]|nr:MAG: integrase [Chloroflexota bacterium]